MSRIYPSKILLIGEYSVLHHGDALCIPNPLYYASWKKAKLPDERLLKLAEYISRQEELVEIIALDKLFQALTDGWYLDSNLPPGSGVGSSGTVCAAILERFQTLTLKDIVRIKKLLALMESFYHGQSSGIDPLVSYLNAPIVVHQDQIIKLDREILLKTKSFTIELVDSGIPRNSKSQIQHFQKQMESEVNRSFFENELMPFNTLAIDAICKGDDAETILAWKKISRQSLAFFTPMIPESVQKIWKSELQNETSYFKLCGAGGGGFFLRLIPNLRA